jgi:surface protein
VSKVQDFSYTFAGAKKFRSNLASWNVGSATNMRFMVRIPPHSRKTRSHSLTATHIFALFSFTMRNHSMLQLNTGMLHELLLSIRCSVRHQFLTNRYQIGKHKVQLICAVCLSRRMPLTVIFQPGTHHLLHRCALCLNTAIASRATFRNSILAVWKILVLCFQML